MANTPKGRISFPNLFKAQKNDAGDEIYSVVLIFTPDDQKSDKFKAMVAAAEDAAKAKFGDKLPSGVKNKSLALKSGWPFTACSEKPDYYGWAPAGSVFVTLTTRYRPQVVDVHTDDILDAAEVYPGCYGRASYRCYAYDNSGNRGVSIGLQNFQKLADGEPLGGARPKATDDFADEESAEDMFA